MLERLLQDVQGRLIFRFQTFLRDGIRAFLTLTLTLTLILTLTLTLTLALTLGQASAPSAPRRKTWTTPHVSARRPREPPPTHSAAGTPPTLPP